MLAGVSYVRCNQQNLDSLCRQTAGPGRPQSMGQRAATAAVVAACPPAQAQEALQGAPLATAPRTGTKALVPDFQELRVAERSS